MDSWTQLRKAFFTVTVLIYAAFSVVLGALGRAQPLERLNPADTARVIGLQSLNPAFTKHWVNPA